MTLPIGTHIQIRLYGEVGALTPARNRVGRATDGPPPTQAPVQPQPAQDFDVAQSRQHRRSTAQAGGSGQIARDSPTARPPIAATGEITREADGRLKQPFTATDDYGVTAGQATITLDLAAVDRRYGLAADPEPREAGRCWTCRCRSAATAPSLPKP